MVDRQEGGVLHVRGDEREPLDNVDSAWLRMEDSTNLMTITGLMVLEDRLDFPRFKELIEDRLLIHDRFRRRVVESPLPFGRPSWVEDEHLTLRAHLRKVALASPHDQAALQDLVSDLMSTPLDRTRPLWQIHVVESYGEGTALIVRLHHCIADGIALVRLLLSLTDPGPGSPPARPAAGPRSVRRPAGGVQAMAGALLDQGREVMVNPERVMEVIQGSAGAVSVLKRLIERPADPVTAFKGRVGIMKKAAWSRPIPLERVKAVGRLFGATVNDVLLEVATGAMRRYMLGRGDDIEGRDVHAVVPVNIRPEEEMDRLGNRFGLVFVALPVGIRDPVERLRTVHRRMAELKRSPETGVVFSVLQLLGLAKPELLALGVDFFGSKATLVMTNVPGPREKLYIAGSRIGNIMFWVPQSAHLGLGISIFSYAGSVHIGIAVDAALVPDPDTLVQHVHGEMDLLAEEAEKLRA
jgi:acyltransferase, WS/DGAT/MGAT